MGQTASPARYAPAATLAFQYKAGGNLRSAIQSAGCTALFVSGLFLWLWPQFSLVLWLHILIGLAILALMAPWLVRHIPEGLKHSRRSGFTWMSWGLLIAMSALVLTGLGMSLPALLWFSGKLWFPPREITEILSLIHFWGAWLALPGLLVHLSMRHWRRTGK